MADALPATERPQAALPPGRPRIPVRIAAAVVLALVSAWIAAGAAGLLGHGLRHALSCLALALAVTAGWPAPGRRLWGLLVIAAASVAAVPMAASALPPLNVLAVCLVFSAVACGHPAPQRRVLLLGAEAVALVAVYRLACLAIPAFWLGADGVGEVLGRAIGWISRQPLWLGATFAALDVLVVMLYLAVRAPLTFPRRGHGPWRRRLLVPVAVALGIVVLGQVLYLAILSRVGPLHVALKQARLEKMAQSWTWSAEKQAGIDVDRPNPTPWLPETGPPPTDSWTQWDRRVALESADPESAEPQTGFWKWLGRQPTVLRHWLSERTLGNRSFRAAVQPLVPWNLPALAVLIQALAGWLVLRRLAALPDADAPPRRPNRALGWSLGAAAALVAVALPMIVIWSPHQPQLLGKKIVLYEEGFLNWERPKHGHYGRLSIGMYGMFPRYLQSLGAEPVVSADLSADDLKDAKLLIIIFPNRPWEEEQLQRVKDFVEKGGSLLVMGEHTILDEDMLQKADAQLAHDLEQEQESNERREWIREALQQAEGVLKPAMDAYRPGAIVELARRCEGQRSKVREGLIGRTALLARLEQLQADLVAAGDAAAQLRFLENVRRRGRNPGDTSPLGTAVAACRAAPAAVLGGPSGLASAQSQAARLLLTGPGGGDLDRQLAAVERESQQARRTRNFHHHAAWSLHDLADQPLNKKIKEWAPFRASDGRSLAKELLKPFAGATALVIDRDPQSSRSLAMLIHGWGLREETAASLGDGLALLRAGRQRGVSYPLLFVDPDLAAESSTRLHDYLKQQAPGSALVFIGEPPERQAGPDAAASSVLRFYLPRPIRQPRFEDVAFAALVLQQRALLAEYISTRIEPDDRWKAEQRYAKADALRKMRDVIQDLETKVGVSRASSAAELLQEEIDRQAAAIARRTAWADALKQLEKKLQPAAGGSAAGASGVPPATPTRRLKTLVDDLNRLKAALPADLFTPAEEERDAAKKESELRESPSPKLIRAEALRHALHGAYDGSVPVVPKNLRERFFAAYRNASASRFNEVLEKLGVNVRVAFDSATFAVGGWLQSYEALMHPAAIGIGDTDNSFGVVIGASVDARAPAWPLLVGRFGHNDEGNPLSPRALMGEEKYMPGEKLCNVVLPGGRRLGDLKLADGQKLGDAAVTDREKLGDVVLAAQQRVGKGRVVVFGDTSNLINGITMSCHPYTSRLLAYLADPGSTPQDPWRQKWGLGLCVALVALLAVRPTPGRIALAAVLLAVTAGMVSSGTQQASTVLPRSNPDEVCGLAYIDASHFGAFSGESLREDGLGGLQMTLVRNGYLTLMLPELTPERLLQPDLGIEVQAVPAEEKPDRPAGLKITRVLPDGPGDEASLEPEMIITAVDYRPVGGEGSEGLVEMKRAYDEALQLHRWGRPAAGHRWSNPIRLKVQIDRFTRRLPWKQLAAFKNKPGLEVATLTAADAAAREHGGVAGVRVERVEPGSPAAAAGIVRNTIVIEVDGRRVKTAEEYHQAVAEHVKANEEGKMKPLSQAPSRKAKVSGRRDNDLVLTFYTDQHEYRAVRPAPGLRAKLLVAVAPNRTYSDDERATIKSFLYAGGVFITTVGWEFAEPSRKLLDELGFSVGGRRWQWLDGPPPSRDIVNYRAGETGAGGRQFDDTRGEPKPLGHFKSSFLNVDNRYTPFVRFWAGWPIDCWLDRRLLICARPADWVLGTEAQRVGDLAAIDTYPLIYMGAYDADKSFVPKPDRKSGYVVLVGDSAFATNKNLENEDGSLIEGQRENADFWRWLLDLLRVGKTSWVPPEPPQARSQQPAAQPGEEAPADMGDQPAAEPGEQPAAETGDPPAADSGQPPAADASTEGGG